MKTHKWPMKDQAEFLRKTGELLERGYPLADAIHSLTYQMKNRQKEDVAQALLHLREGHPFHQILSNLGFNQTLVGYVYFAEEHGSLADAFREGSTMILKRQDDVEKLKKLLVYPTILIAVTLFLFFFVEKVLLPQYILLFSSMNLKPNIFMRVVSFIGEASPFFVILLLLCVLLLLSYYFMTFRRLLPLKQRSLMANIPFFGSFYRLFTTHYFSVQLSYLLAGGLSVHEALKVFEKYVQSPFYKQIGQEMQLFLIRGESFEAVLTHYDFFARELPFIVKHGQENGKLSEELLFFSKHCLEKLENKTEKTFKIVQPILYSLIGLIIVSMYLAILLPMFQLLDGF
ncbi:competence type IV pilus assembly protein ComGB [Robertmurraya sp. DFI.2.37]|uniref:competence type IV pilus assembly protein ComGB n=1 Tax=Robertmurraya sp. DFI.2.37 TaxID=3031819 RepID=UPI0012457561|nr:competence type IV pilus assembly protein ComGB [Robertmurraya sp. DFI.2.37]MDF1507607.1 competence type IV pilus assembly protein ComGB [Robertmurraya sp. DFI.2.37]